ncbi:hypothetical protein [Halochromatium glycolicum]|uniref:Glycoside hydrolase family 5 domain-containing protein n=1 Tax=Halochromatium glycolicum TaxID=85075 RepID=A0AAJ0X7I3_9GAMM|nr:hypothetical protein [Halochromatium glycolicum]MBK1703159.1 hypothetical protein [Halochromatium glycolicum]
MNKSPALVNLMRVVVWSLVMGALSGPANAFSLLDSGIYLGVQPGFELNDPDGASAAVQTKLQEAFDAGVSVVPVGAEWPELEPSRNNYNKQALRQRLEYAKQRGLKPVPLLYLIDSEGVLLPSYLNPDDEELISLSQVDITDSAIMERYKALLDWVVPMVAEYDGFAIMVGNEPDNHLEDHPGEAAEVLEFLRQAKRHIRGINPDMAVAIALSDGFDKLQPYSIDIVDESDFASFNFYCSLENFEIDSEQIAARLDRRINAAKGKPVMIQELGCASGIDTDSAAAAAMLERQKQWFETTFTLMESRPSIRVAMVFQLMDWGDWLLNYYRELLRPVFMEETNNNEEMTNMILDTVTASLGSIGLLKADGSPKPAWNSFLSELSPPRPIPTPKNLRTP